MVRCLFSSNCFFLRSFSFSSSWVSTSPKTTAGRGCKTEPQTGHGAPSFKALARIPACAQKNFSFSVSYSTTACFASLISVFNCSCNFSFSVWRAQSIFSFLYSVSISRHSAFRHCIFSYFLLFCSASFCSCLNFPVFCFCAFCLPQISRYLISSVSSAVFFSSYRSKTGLI